MGNDTILEQRISGRLEQHLRDLADKQLRLDADMKEMLEQRERFSVYAAKLIETVVRPRLAQLVSHFDNGKVETVINDLTCSCYCEFSHTPRFPATVSLAISLLQVTADGFLARYDLNIFPMLMEYTRIKEETFPLADNDDEALAGWVENRIIDFLDTYLQLETNPYYQKDNTVIDIVCGMRISTIAATSSVERNGRIFYFCSDHCKESFVKANGGIPL